MTSSDVDNYFVNTKVKPVKVQTSWSGMLSLSEFELIGLQGKIDSLGTCIFLHIYPIEMPKAHRARS